MSRLAQVHLSIVRDYRHSGNEVKGYLGLGHDEVDFSKIACGFQKFRDICPEEFCEFEKYAYDFPLLRELQFLYLVVQFHDFGRFDERCLS